MSREFFESGIFTIGWAGDMYTTAIYAFSLIFYIAFESSFAFSRSCYESAPNSFSRCGDVQKRVYESWIFWKWYFYDRMSRGYVYESDLYFQFDLLHCFRIVICVFPLVLLYEFALNSLKGGGVQKCVYESWILAVTCQFSMKGHNVPNEISFVVWGAEILVF